MIIPGTVFGGAGGGGGIYTVATAPDPATRPGQTIWVEDGATGSPTGAISDGTNWLRFTTGAAIAIATYSPAVLSNLLFYLQRNNPGTGATWNDAGSNNFDATLEGDAAWSSGVVDMDGSGDYAQVPSDTLLQRSGTDPVSVSIWLKWRSSTGAHNRIFETTHPTLGGMGMLLTAAGRVRAFLSPGGETDDSGPVVPFDTWTLISFTYDGDKIRVYQDDALTITSGSVSGYGATGLPWTFGKSLLYGGSFDGQMSDVVAVARALTLSEIQDIYSMGAPA